MNITFKGENVTLIGKELQVGDIVEDFRVVKNDLSEVSLSDIKGKCIVLSVPSLDTGVCSMEVEKFIQYLEGFQDVTCLCISMDLPFALDRWCQSRANGNVITASDYKYHEFAKVAGVMVEELGLLTRACFVLDEQHKLIYREYVKEIGNEPNYDAILNACR